MIPLYLRMRVGVVFLAVLTDAALATSFAYITNAGSDSVSVIDADRNVVVSTVPIGIGSQAVAANATNGACPAGTVPVYRLCNSGMGAAPNHRFVTSLTEPQSAISRRWVGEGAGIGVGMCVPK